MVEIIFQAAALASFLAGILIAEAVTYRVFGRPKPTVVVLDIVLFVVIVTIISNLFSFSELSWFVYIVNFLIGLFTILITRTIEGALGLTETTVARDKLLVNVVKALSRAGLSEEEIEDILKRSGFSPKAVERFQELLQNSAPPLLGKLAKISEDLDEIKKEVKSLGKKKRRL